VRRSVVLEMEDVFHHGLVVEDLEAAMHDLEQAFRVEWTSVEAVQFAIRTPQGRSVVDLRLVYTRQGPSRIELIQAVPETVWELPAVGSFGWLAPHHIGVWCDDIPGTSRHLTESGAPLLVTADDGTDEAAGFAYHRTPSGSMIEIFDRVNKPAFEDWFAGGPFPMG
jgi:hypothetical protein